MPTLTFNGITLDPSMIWNDRNQSKRVAQSVTRTLGGGAVVQAAAISQGLPITIASGQDQGLLRWPVVQQLEDLADVPGAVYVLDVDGTEYSVIFRHDEPPAFSADPLLARVAPFDEDYFRCTLKLMTV
jgi:hypothetical protein